MALRCAEVGWHVFPIRSRGKEPTVKWVEWASTDQAKITAEFAGRELNYAIACGPSGLLVIDEDELDALATFAADRGVTVPVTYTVRTGRGRHHYFRAPDAVPLGNTEGTLKGHGLNVRGNGGYVLGPGSTHPSGAVYEVEVNAPVASCPDWLITALRATKPSPTDAWPFEPPPINVGRYDELPDTIKHHERQQTVMRYASSMHARNVPKGWAKALVDLLWQRCEQPPNDPFTPDEARAILDDIYQRYPAGPSTDYAVPVDADPHTQAVHREAERLRVRDEAQAIVHAENAEAVDIPAPTRLDTFLAQPVPDVTYRIERLAVIGGRVLLAAQHKAGKTTLVGNLIKSYVDDNVPFLSTFAVQPARRVVLIDNELTEAMLHGWLRAHGIRHPERVELISLRGRMFSFDVLNRGTRARWAATIGNADAVILDCLRPALDALGLSEDKDTGRFLVAFDAMLAEAGIGECYVVHHMGHTGERARGDSRLLDWPDALWRLVIEGGENGARADPGAPRYFTAYGRDVELGETLLAFDPFTRRLSVAGGSRQDAKITAALADVIAYLRELDDPVSGRQLHDALAETRHSRDVIREAIKKGKAEHVILIGAGPNRSELHFLNPSARVRGGARVSEPRTGGQCAGAPLKEAHPHGIPANPEQTPVRGSAAQPLDQPEPDHTCFVHGCTRRPRHGLLTCNLPDHMRKEPAPHAEKGAPRS